MVIGRVYEELLAGREPADAKLGARRPGVARRTRRTGSTLKLAGGEEGGGGEV